MKDYRIVIKRRLKKKWDALKKEAPEAVERTERFLKATPEDRLKAGGKLKKLKGRLKGILQYDITDAARVWYKVDRKERVIYIKYVGHHP